MAERLPPFLKREGHSIIFIGEGTLVFFLPEAYFDRENAIIMGDTINTIGIFNYCVYSKDGKPGKLIPFYFPSSFLTQPSETEIKRNIKLTNNSNQEDYRLLKYIKNDVVIVSTKVPQMTENIEEFFSIVIGGNLTNTIEYNKLHEYPYDAAALNGKSFSFSPQLFGMLFSELCRDSENLSIPFRLSKSKDMTNYKTISIKEAPKYTSAYTALTSENWDDATVAAVMNKSHKFSPLEKIMML